MRQIANLLKIIDQFLFQQVEQLVESSSYRKLTDSLSSMPEQTQKTINYTLSFLLIALPLIPVLILIISNSSLKGDIELKYKIKNEIESFQTESSKLTKVTTGHISTFKGSSKEQLQEDLNQVLKSVELDSTKASVVKFETLTLGSELNKHLTTIDVKELTTEKFTALLNKLLIQKRMKIINIDVTRNKEKMLIEGNLEFAIFSTK